MAHQRELFLAGRSLERRRARVAERLRARLLLRPAHVGLVGQQLVSGRVDACQLVHRVFVRGEQALHQRQLRVAAQRPRLLHRLGLRRPYDHLRHHVAPQLVREGIALHHVVQRLDRLPLRRDVPVGHRVGHVVSDEDALAVRFRQCADHSPRVSALCQHAIQLILARALDLVIPSLEQRVRRLADRLRPVHANFRACFIRALPASLFEGGVSGADGRSCHPFRKAHPALRDDPLFRGHLNGALHLRRFAAFLDLLPRLEVGGRVFLVVLSVAVESVRVALRRVPVFVTGQVRAFKERAHAVRVFAVESAALGLRQRLKRLCRPRAQRVVRNGVDAANHRRRVRRVGVDALPVKAHQGHFGQLQHGRVARIGVLLPRFLLAVNLLVQALLQLRLSGNGQLVVQRKLHALKGTAGLPGHVHDRFALAVLLQAVYARQARLVKAGRLRRLHRRAFGIRICFSDCARAVILHRRFFRLFDLRVLLVVLLFSVIPLAHRLSLSV